MNDETQSEVQDKGIDLATALARSPQIPVPEKVLYHALRSMRDILTQILADPSEEPPLVDPESGRPVYGPCTRCGYTWMGHLTNPKIPRQCARCHSPAWQTPKRAVTAESKWKGKRGSRTTGKRNAAAAGKVAPVPVSAPAASPVDAYFPPLPSATPVPPPFDWLKDKGFVPGVKLPPPPPPVIQMKAQTPPLEPDIVQLVESGTRRVVEEYPKDGYAQEKEPTVTTTAAQAAPNPETASKEDPKVAGPYDKYTYSRAVPEEYVPIKLVETANQGLQSLLIKEKEGPTVKEESMAAQIVANPEMGVADIAKLIKRETPGDAIREFISSQEPPSLSPPSDVTDPFFAPTEAAKRAFFADPIDLTPRIRAVDDGTPPPAPVADEKVIVNTANLDAVLSKLGKR